MYNYNNPCYCSTLTPGGGGKSCDGECISAPQMLLIGEGSIAPCGERKTILWDDCMDICTCELKGDAVTYSVWSEQNLKITSINETGIEIESDAANTDDTLGVARFIVKCGSLSVMGSITVVFKKLCLDVNCDDGYECNKCTGNCESMGADLDVT